MSVCLFIVCPGASVMPLTVEAIYENGVLKPIEPLPLKEHERVLVHIQPGETPLLRAYGLLGWTGDPEELRRLAVHPDLDLEDEP
jgi:predicted DNA-binding antitoxin AbrB/MazE fold protein